MFVGIYFRHERVPLTFFFLFFLSTLDYAILGEMSRAFIGETPEAIASYKEDLFKTITAKGESAGFGAIADVTTEFRRSSIGGRDRILDWYKFNTIKKKVDEKSRQK